MKRVFAAAAILVGITALCVCTLMIQQRVSNHLLVMADEVSAAFDNGDTETCIRLSKELAETFSQETEPFLFFMRHSEIAKIEESLLSLAPMLEYEESGHFAAEFAKSYNMLEKLAKLETPTLANVL